MKIYVIGYKGRGFGSSFIKWFTFSDYSHVSLVFDGVEYEALQKKGVIKHEYKQNKDSDEFYVEVTPDEYDEALRVAESMVGAKYDWKGIWGFVARRDRHSKGKWFCSEAVAYTLHKANKPLSRREPYRHRPDDVCMSYVLHEAP